MKHIVSITLLMAAILYGCVPKSSNEEAKTDEVDLVDEAVTEIRLEKLWETDTLLTTSESVIYNPDADLLYVSNVNGQPLEKDGNGFISQVDMDGNILVEKWITDLHAPKGMGLYNAKLYVTNIDELVEIDVETGAITNRYKIDGGVFLNDITVDANGTVYFSDSGTNKIHQLKDGQVSEFLSAEALGGPNGLYAEEERIMLATYGTGQFGYIDLATNEVVIKTDSVSAGDGVTPDGNGHYLVSSWTGEIFHINGENWEKTSLLKTGKDSIQSADITYLTEQRMLLVPTFFKNTVCAYRLIEE